ncbi:hypothetical protein Rsub_05373 [Raphidocelis subcapitata]|uniref:Major facilitator superfamily associated domain-containing protein n=1 Tax=Raphidocelis subcapitata TaxID=307507 RepID=A0A2V0P364_9CHLO|nr:hypothetical protein Rsub_05373 [Raphidocelis subcapitata]|eukprot:GBF92290.1 hypothetical protein Rsub_05373 [Raphidocelis subcapitata]
MGRLSDRDMLIAKIWYFFFYGGLVFFMPYVPLFLKRDLGWEPWRVGLVQGLRPWISAACSLTLCSVVDRLKLHKPMLMVCFVVSSALRGSLALVPARFAIVAPLILLADAVASPIAVIADSSVVAKCKRDGDYGKQRVFASIAWGSLAVVSGGLLSHSSVKWGILVYMCMCVPCLPLAWLLNPGPKRPAAPPRDSNPSSSGSKEAEFKAKAAAAAQLEDAGEDLIGTRTMKEATVEAARAASPHGPGKSPLPHAQAPAGPRHSRHPSGDHDGSLRARLLTLSTRGRVPSSSNLLAHLQLQPVEPARQQPQQQQDRPFVIRAYQPPAPLLEPVHIDSGSSCPTTPRSMAALLDAEREPTPAAAAAADQQQPPEGEQQQPAPLAAPSSEAPATLHQRGDSACDLPRLGACKLQTLGEVPPLPEEPCAPEPAACEPAPEAAAADGADGGNCGGNCSCAPEALVLSNLAGDAGRSLLAHELRCYDSATSDAHQPASDGAPPAPAPCAARRLSGDCSCPGPCKPPAAAPGASVPEDAGVGSLLRQPRVLVFMFRALVIGYGIGTQVSFAFLLVREMGADELLMGVMLMCSILTEGPAFQFQSVLLARIPVSLVMHGSMLLLALRLACYAFLRNAPSPWCVLPVELLQGVTFATAWGAGIVNCKRISPPRLNTTMQSVFSALFAGVGPGIGGLIGGFNMQRYGAATMFGITAAIIVACWAAAWAMELLIGISERRAAIRESVRGGFKAGASSFKALGGSFKERAGGGFRASRGGPGGGSFKRMVELLPAEEPAAAAVAEAPAGPSEAGARGAEAPPFASLASNSTSPMLRHGHQDSAVL